MKSEYEVIDHARLKDVKIFLVNMSYRRPHIHKEIELCYLMSGQITIISGKDKMVVKEGDLFLFNQNQPHEFQIIDNKALLLVVQISPKYCRRFYPEIHNMQFMNILLKDILPEKSKKQIIDDMIQAGYQYYLQSEGFEFLCMSSINTIFYHLVKHVPAELISKESKILQDHKTERLNRILDYIEDHYEEKISLSEIADIEGLTLTYLSHFFSDNLNISFQEYVTELRFEKALKLIEKTDMRLIDISEECGFSDYRYLNKIYQKRFGCTPTEFRQSGAQRGSGSFFYSLGSTQEFYGDQETLRILGDIILGGTNIL